MSSWSSRVARAIIRRYPRAWRERYEVELLGFIEDTPVRWRDVLDLARGCVVERARTLVVEPEQHPRVAWMLFGAARFLVAVVFYAVLVGVASLLHATEIEPPSFVVWTAGLSFPVLMAVGFWAWIRAMKRGPWSARTRVPPRWGVATWLALFSLAGVVIYWTHPPGTPPSRLWYGDLLHWYIWPLWIHYAMGLYSPTRLQLECDLERIANLVGALRSKRRELRRSQSLVPEGMESMGVVLARVDIARIERELDAAVADVRSKRTTRA